MAGPKTSTFVWTPAAEERARVRVLAGKPPYTVARAVGAGCTGADVLALAALRGWVRPLKRRNWDAAAIEAVRALYVDQQLAPLDIAARLGPPWTWRKVARLANRMRWGKTRDRAVSDAHRLARLAAGSGAAIAARRRKAAERVSFVPARPSTVPAAVRRPLEAEDLPRLIAEAVAAGKVTVLPPMYAAGLTGVEGHFWGAGPGGSWKAQAAKRNAAVFR